MGRLQPFFIFFNMIEIRGIDITEEMILNETDIQVIIKWKNELLGKLSEFKVKTAPYKKLNVGQKKVEASIWALIKLCKAKIGDYNLKLKEEGKWKYNREIKTQRHLASVFMEIAKNRLDKQVYKDILELAQSKINEV